MQDKLQRLCSDFFSRLGLESPKAFDFPLQIRVDDIAITFEYDTKKPDSLIIHTALGVLPAEHELALYRAFLDANLFWTGTADATIGVNSSTREAVIAYAFDYRDMNGERLVVLVEQFTILTELWLRFIETVGQEGIAKVPNLNKLAFFNRA